jgi:ubiquinone/menaquinone biosynthesis C-methylase UbiE
MSKQDIENHRSTIVEQFSQQAIPFAKVPGHLDSIQLLVELAGVSTEDFVLDVACGPGLVACEFARSSRQVIGIDITPAMIKQAESRQLQENLENLSWRVGEAVPLDFPDDTFSLVITRYSFHHLLSPLVALKEMIRVCKPGGRILVADVAMPAGKSAAYDRLELMRDPSHTHALSRDEFEGLFDGSGLLDCRQASYDVEIELEGQLAASFPSQGDKERLRDMIIADIGVNRFGINSRIEGDVVSYTVPIAVFVGRKP